MENSETAIYQWGWLYFPGGPVKRKYIYYTLSCTYLSDFMGGHISYMIFWLNIAFQCLHHHSYIFESESSFFYDISLWMKWTWDFTSFWVQGNKYIFSRDHGRYKVGEGIWTSWNSTFSDVQIWSGKFKKLRKIEIEEGISNHLERHTKETKPLQKAKWAMESQENDIIIPGWWV